MRYDTDVDECAVNNASCSPYAYCTNTPGNFTCDCMPGYIGDGFTCTGDIASWNSPTLLAQTSEFLTVYVFATSLISGYTV